MFDFGKDAGGQSDDEARLPVTHHLLQVVEGGVESCRVEDASGLDAGLRWRTKRRHGPAHARQIVLQGGELAIGLTPVTDASDVEADAGAKPNLVALLDAEKVIAESFRERKVLNAAGGVVVVAEFQAGDVFLELAVGELQSQEAVDANLRRVDAARQRNSRIQFEERAVAGFVAGQTERHGAFDGALPVFFGPEGGEAFPERRFNAVGTAQGSEFQVNTYTTGDQFDPAVAID
ncbi:MAG: hypothetical protein ABL982_23790, partial [Vicinamibacterales bacterium]